MRPEWRVGICGRGYGLAVLVLWCATFAPGASGWSAERTVANPPELAVVRRTVRPAAPRVGAALALPAPSAGASDEAYLDLDIAYTTDASIWNPTTGQHDKVKLRSYNDLFPAPTIRLRPGDTARLTLANDLPIDNCVAPQGTHSTPSCFNTTNMHSHGLWVSPVGNSDNVLLEIGPGITFQYEYNIPRDHPAGTFWYHPHRHGSTALQVGSGMGGALVIEGRRPPTSTSPGDIDTILVAGHGEPMRERVVLFQQVQYACRNAQGNIKTPPGKPGPWVCDPGDVGGVDGYDQFGPGSWATSGRYTTLNGEVQPVVLDIEAGQIERWRMIHAGVRDTIAMQVRKLAPGAAPLDTVAAADQAAWLAQSCTGEIVPQWEIATDGLTRPQVAEKADNVLQPGYRSDVLLLVREPGDYCVLDLALPAVSNVSAADEGPRLLARLRVTGTAVTAPLRELVQAALVAGAGTLPADVRGRVTADLEDGLRLAAFVWHPDIPLSEVTGSQQLAFSIDVSSPPAVRFGIDHRSYDPSRIDRLLTLGGVDEWTLTSTLASHPFHIHVNPFQVVRILNPTGVDVTDPALPYDERLKLEGGDPQYLDLKGVWKDTLFTKQGYRVVFRTRYQRYIGDYVLHCHILDHEDQGMMQNVRVALPGTVIPGLAGGHARH